MKYQDNQWIDRNAISGNGQAAIGGEWERFCVRRGAGIVVLHRDARQQAPKGDRLILHRTASGIGQSFLSLTWFLENVGNRRPERLRSGHGENP